MDDTTKKILEIVTGIQDQLSDVQQRMATKDDIRNLQEQINNHTRMIEANTKAIADMAEQLRSVFGYAKEIDLLMSRVSAIERHVGISK